MEVLVPSSKRCVEAQCMYSVLQEGMEGQGYLVPPNDLSDLVHFIFNNLSVLSLPTMANKFRESVNHTYLSWMAQ